MNRSTQKFDDLIELKCYYYILKRRTPSIFITFIIVFIVGIYMLLNLPKKYQAVCDVKIIIDASKMGPFGFNSKTTVDSEVYTIGKKKDLIGSVVKILQNKALNKAPFNDVDTSYLSNDEVRNIEKYTLDEDTKQYIRGTLKESSPFEFKGVLATILNQVPGLTRLEQGQFTGVTTDYLLNILIIKPIKPDSNIIEIKAVTPHRDLSVAIVNFLATMYRCDYGRSEIIEAASTKELLAKKVNEIFLYLDQRRSYLKELSVKNIKLGSPQIYQKELSLLKLDLSRLNKRYTEGNELIDKQKKLIAQVESELEIFPIVKMEYEKLKDDWKSKKAHMTMLENLYAKAQIDYDAKLHKAKESIQIVAFATAANSANQLALYGMVLVILGTGIACSQGILRESLSCSLTINSIEELSGSSILAEIPTISGRFSTKYVVHKYLPTLLIFMSAIGLYKRRAVSYAEKILFNYDQISPLAETFRTMRTNLLFSLDHSCEGKTIAVTSSIAGEGKTFNAVNLAVTMAKAGKRTLLVDADMRKPKVGRLLNLSKDSKGLSDLLIDDSVTFKDVLISSKDYVAVAPWDDKMKKTVAHNLMILPSGHIPHSPGDLLTSCDFSDLVDKLKTVFDYVVFDTPPGLPVSDASLIASLLDGVIVVFNDESNGRYLSRLMHSLKKSGSLLLGIVVNRQRPEHNAGYGYGYKLSVLDKVVRYGTSFGMNDVVAKEADNEC